MQMRCFENCVFSKWVRQTQSWKYLSKNWGRWQRKAIHFYTNQSISQEPVKSSLSSDNSPKLSFSVSSCRLWQWRQVGHQHLGWCMACENRMKDARAIYVSLQWLFNITRQDFLVSFNTKFPLLPLFLSSFRIIPWLEMNHVLRTLDTVAKCLPLKK